MCLEPAPEDNGMVRPTVVMPATQENVSGLFYEAQAPRAQYESGIGLSVAPIRRHDKKLAKTTLNGQNLEALGALRLAELLIELSQGNATAKRRLRMELAGTRGTDVLAKEVRNRITTMGRSRSFVDWQGIRSLADDLDTQRRAIVEKVAKGDPKEALDLLWRLMALASSVFERCDDSNGRVIAVFHEACQNIGDVAQRANTNPTALADQAFDALTRNDYGQFDELISVLSPVLGQAGLEHLKRRMVDLSTRPVENPAENDRVKICGSSSGPIYADEMAESSRVS